jgi:hypothetical protein
MRIDRAIWDGLAWMSRNLGEFREPYALYSLEKVCDLAGIELLDGKDWHALGSRHLITQRMRGEAGWDTADTGLALLFLSRATRSKLHALGPPVFVTPRGGEPVPEHREDLVHVHAAGGFLPAWVIFEFAALSRDPRLGPVIDEALKATPPGRAHEALARVLWLWSEDADAMTALARRAAASIAGAELEDRGAASELVALLAEIHEIERSDEPGADRLRPLLAAGGSPTLLRRALDLVEREGMIDVLGLVADLVAHEEPAVRRRAHEVLARWTGEPFAAPPGAGANSAELERAALAWKDWWKRSGAAFLTRRRAARLIARVESSPTPEEREASIEEVVALGAGAVPAILEAMDRGEFSIHLVRALERITGESRGLRAVDWRR